MTIIQGVDAWQNTQINAVNGEADAAYAHGNNAYNYANTMFSITQGIDNGQNTTIRQLITLQLLLQLLSKW
jgi:hypothetical protein